MGTSNLAIKNLSSLRKASSSLIMNLTLLVLLTKVVNNRSLPSRCIERANGRLWRQHSFPIILLSSCDTRAVPRKLAGFLLKQSWLCDKKVQVFAPVAAIHPILTTMWKWHMPSPIEQLATKRGQPSSAESRTRKSMVLPPQAFCCTNERSQ